MRTALFGKSYSLLWGSNCTGAALLKRAAIATADCGAIALSNATVDSGQNVADAVQVRRAGGARLPLCSNSAAVRRPTAAHLPLRSKSASK